MGLVYGDELNVPGLGKQDIFNLAEHYGVSPNAKNFYDTVIDKVWDAMSEKDWKAQRDYLDKYYEPGMTSHVSPTVLERVVRMHPTFNDFFEANRELLTTRDMDYDALASGRKLIGPFTTPDMGEIYPLFVKSKRPFVISSAHGSDPMYWNDTENMLVNTKSLSPIDLDQARFVEKNKVRELIAGLSDFDTVSDTISDDERRKLLSEAYKDYDAMSKRTHYPDNVSVRDFFDGEAGDIFDEGKPTDNLVGATRLNGMYDGVLTKNVYDGGGGNLPPTDTFAFFDNSQVKSERNLGTFSPKLNDIYRTLGPALLGGGVLAAAMGRPTGASAAALPSGWVPPSAKAELEGMEPSGWMDPVNWVVDAATAGGGAAMRAGQAALGAAQDWLGEQVPQIPEVPEEYYEAAQ